MHTVCAYTRVGVFSRSEQNEHARLCGVGVPPGAAGGEDRGTHHLLQPQRDEVDEGRQQCRGRKGTVTPTGWTFQQFHRCATLSLLVVIWF